MKRQIRLKWFVSLVFLGLGLALVIGYSLLSANYFILGMDTMIASNLEKAITRYARELPQGQQQGAVEIDGYPISRRWQDQPADIRQRFAHAPSEDGVLYKNDAAPGLKTPKTIYFTLAHNVNGETWYISHRLSRESVSQLMHENITRSLDTLLLISIVSIIAFAVLIWFILGWVSRPVAALGAWTHGLNSDNLNQAIPNFTYPELNELAELIQTSLSSVQENLEREHRFLRHTSHELRTPISVLRSNIELIHRLDRDASEYSAARKLEALERIDRASLTMKHLTETLLWLSRDESETLPTRRVSLNILVEQLVEEMRYLLQHKPVEVELRVEPYASDLPEVAARIVIGNLIRNAFQHTWHGRITITQRGNRIEIFNPSTEEAMPTEDDLGFGLGLQLTEQLCARLSWPYSSRADAAGYRAAVTLTA